ncbi:MAG: amylo-alpha-1,6-glucosidase [Bdellovibrionota bacterium]
MDEWTFRLVWDPNREEVPEELLRKEWLVTNGLGAYASGTLSGVPTRRYHGFLVAALPAPFGRQMMLEHLSEMVTFADGETAFLSMGLAEFGQKDIHRFSLVEFRLDLGLPVWVYSRLGVVLERRIQMMHGHNTVQIAYRMVDGDEPVTIRVQPSIHFRAHEDEPGVENLSVYSLTEEQGGYAVSAGGSSLPPLKLFLHARKQSFLASPSTHSLLYREEKNRGYPCEGALWSPGHFEALLGVEAPVTLLVSTETWESILALNPAEALEAEHRRREKLIAMAAEPLRRGPARQLVLAADQFVITPAGRVEDDSRARAQGEQARSVIAGYHWFTDWGRDTMISLEGLTLDTGRTAEARWILHTFSQHIRRGLIPNLFPEGQREGLYHTADATLWFFHAVSRYVARSGDSAFLDEIVPKLQEIIDWHVRGTDFGIGVDPKDGLLRQGEPGYQLTWMDAKVGDWVVTPRRGKAVEINALWYNALKLLEGWTRALGNEPRADSLSSMASRVRESFNERFWNEAGGYLFDVVDGETMREDPACRPNQLFSISLENPVLDPSRWAAVLSVVERELLTPVGLRSLAPGHPDYKATYSGDLRARDAAYHQGTVWGWLIGPFVDAWRKVNPDSTPEDAKKPIAGLLEHLFDAGLGTVSEIFDAVSPFTPRGCIAQAWSVAELIRILSKDGNSDSGGEQAIG